MEITKEQRHEILSNHLWEVLYNSRDHKYFKLLKKVYKKSIKKDFINNHIYQVKQSFHEMMTAGLENHHFMEPVLKGNIKKRPNYFKKYSSEVHEEIIREICLMLIHESMIPFWEKMIPLATSKMCVLKEYRDSDDLEARHKELNYAISSEIIALIFSCDWEKQLNKGLPRAKPKGFAKKR